MTASTIDRPKPADPSRYRLIRCRITADDRTVVRHTVTAVSLSLLDWSIPLPIPGVKPGLANIAILVAMARGGWSMAWQIALLRVLVVSLLVGTFLSPGFWLSLTGSLCSLIALKAAMWLPKMAFTSVSQSLVAAFAHIVGQLVIVDRLIFPIDSISALMPIFAASATVTGIVNGLLAARLLADNPEVS